jgi:molybdopterin converting factor small subunit
MSVEIELSPIFARYSNNQLNISVEGKTVGECFNDLFRQFPDLKKMLLTREGNLQHAYDVYINGKSAYPMEMKKPVKDGDKLNIVFIIHGG